MELNPLSLLEVTMGGDPGPTLEEDDDCVIVETPIPVHDITEDDPLPEEEVMEVMPGAGIHFLQQVQDPLASLPHDNRNIPLLWVNSHIANLANTTPPEMKFRSTTYKDLENVLNCKLHCTICQDHIGCDIRVHQKAIEHPILKVLVCERCTTHYKKLNFIIDHNGKETRCRWCGKSPLGGGFPLRRCQQCPFAFCEKCLEQNFTILPPRNILWTCCACNLKDLWPARALLWALQSLKQRLISKPSTSAKFGSEGDVSSCCKGFRKKYAGKPGPKHKHAPPAPTPARDFEAPSTSHQLPTQVIVNGTPMLRPKIYQLPNFSKQNFTPGGPMKLIRIPNPGGNILPAPAPLKIGRPRRPPTPHPMPDSSRRETLSPAFEHPPFPNCENDLVCTIWLQNKIDWYIRGVDQLKSKLLMIKDKLPEYDSIKNVQIMMDSMSSLLDLNSTLLRDSGINLINDWKERKTRHIIDSINIPGPSEVPQIVESVPVESLPGSSESHNATQSVPSPPPDPQNTCSEEPLSNPASDNLDHKAATPKKGKAKKKPKRLLLHKSKNLRSMANVIAKQKMEEELKKKFSIRECSVTLTRLEEDHTLNRRTRSYHIKQIKQERH